MKVRLKKKANGYAQVSVNMLRDRSLTLKAKGLGAVLESYSNDFEVSMKSIELNATDGIKSVRSAIKELENGLYLFRLQTRDSGGLFTTYWAFDSQQLDFEYLKEMVSELEKIEQITKKDLLDYRGSPDGDAVTDTPSAACRSTASRQSTTYNNTTFKNKENKNNLSKKRESFTDFRSATIDRYTGKSIACDVPGFMSTTVISLSPLGFLHNKVSNKDLSPTDAKKIWEWLYKNPEVIGEGV